mmetsp:Transcript_46230/g.119148  ORF Transcript_46230/g.119148 Transcript_46230/m.119148 type:complete len:228 (-) Transcript_46230:340-1023(-)
MQVHLEGHSMLCWPLPKLLRRGQVEEEEGAKVEDKVGGRKYRQGGEGREEEVLRRPHSKIGVMTKQTSCTRWRWRGGGEDSTQPYQLKTTPHSGRPLLAYVIAIVMLAVIIPSSQAVQMGWMRGLLAESTSTCMMKTRLNPPWVKYWAEGVALLQEVVEEGEGEGEEKVEVLQLWLKPGVSFLLNTLNTPTRRMSTSLTSSLTRTSRMTFSSSSISACPASALPTLS